MSKIPPHVLYDDGTYRIVVSALGQFEVYEKTGDSLFRGETYAKAMGWIDRRYKAETEAAKLKISIPCMLVLTGVRNRYTRDKDIPPLCVKGLFTGYHRSTSKPLFKVKGKAVDADRVLLVFPQTKDGEENAAAALLAFVEYSEAQTRWSEAQQSGYSTADLRPRSARYSARKLDVEQANKAARDTAARLQFELPEPE